MKELLRKYIRKQIEFLFEQDRASAAASAAQGTSTTQGGKVDPASYDELKTKQLAQIDSLKANQESIKLRQSVNADKINKLSKTFSQVQDNDLATMPGGKSEDNKVKAMKKANYLKDKKKISDELKKSQEQIKDAEETLKDIDTMKQQAEMPQKSAETPSPPAEPTGNA